jgi:hypothetical protein
VIVKNAGLNTNERGYIGCAINRLPSLTIPCEVSPKMRSTFSSNILSMVRGMLEVLPGSETPLVKLRVAARARCGGRYGLRVRPGLNAAAIDPGIAWFWRPCEKQALFEKADFHTLVEYTGHYVRARLPASRFAEEPS